MARQFQDGAGTSWNTTIPWQFVNNPFTSYALFNLGTSPDLGTQPFFSGTNWGNLTATQKVKARMDNSLPGIMRDCAECHVGGGAHEYKPAASPEARLSLRTLNFGGVMTAYNYFIDTYGTRGDGYNKDGSRASYDVTLNDYSQTGVIEMDCFVCHLSGYDYESRKSAIRRGFFDASRAVGVGLANYTSLVNGVTVNYDLSKLVQTTFNSQPALKFSPATAANILGTPDADNCSKCHMDSHAVDWKKRGDAWTPSSEVHYAIGCMGCHQRKDKDFSKMGTSGFAGLKGTKGFGNISSNTPGDDSKKLGQCDPTKGNAPFNSIWNAKDSSAKNCYGCHISGGDLVNGQIVPFDTMGAMNPTARHQELGLSAKIVQKGTTMNGTANASHLDLITCAACHSRKLTVTTGGAMIDTTGNDVEGRLTDHENQYVERNMVKNVVYTWQNVGSTSIPNVGSASGVVLIPANLSTSLFWRDKNDVGTDANNDGRELGMDSLLQTHVMNINHRNGRTEAITADGIITGAEVSQRIRELTTELEYELGLKANLTDPNVKLPNGLTTMKASPIKLSLMVVPFKANHNVSSSYEAWGMPKTENGNNGCADCHAPNKGFFNGTYQMAPKFGNLATQFTYSSAMVTPLTQINGSTATTDFHPNLRDRSGIRSVEVKIATGRTSLRDIDHSETMYETSFMKRDTTWKNTIAGSAVVSGWPTGTANASGVTGTTKGWVLQVEVYDPGINTAQPAATVAATTKVTKQVTALFADFATMLASGNTNGLNPIADNPYFTISESGNALTITAKNNSNGNPYWLRLTPQADVGSMGLTSQLWAAQTWTGVGGGTYTGRTAWVSYLEGLNNAAAFGIGVDPVAAISTTGLDEDATNGGIQVQVGNSKTLAATTTGNTTSTIYEWFFNDGTAKQTGASISKTFSKLGTTIVTLRVTDEEGKVKQTSIGVNVVSAIGAQTFTLTETHVGKAYTFSLAGMPAHTSYTLYFGDGQKYSEVQSTATDSYVYTYATSGKRRVTLQLFSNSAIVATKYIYVDVP